MALIQRNTAYSVNDIVNTKFGIKLKCTTAGTTSTDPLILDGTSPITDGTVVWEVSEEQGQGSEIYSTTEQRIGTWIDGKQLYQKTFQINTPSTANSAETVAYLYDLSIDKVVYLDGMVYRTEGVRPFAYSINGYNYNAEYGRIFTYIGSSTSGGQEYEIEIIVPTYLTNTTGYITIKYTKTTN